MTNLQKILLIFLLFLTGCGILFSRDFIYGDKVKVVCGFHKGMSGIIEDQNPFTGFILEKRYEIRFTNESIDFEDSSCLEKLND